VGQRITGKISVKTEQKGNRRSDFTNVIVGVLSFFFLPILSMTGFRCTRDASSGFIIPDN
jgi:hypothetical protein